MTEAKMTLKETVFDYLKFDPKDKTINKDTNSYFNIFYVNNPTEKQQLDYLDNGGRFAFIAHIAGDSVKLKALDMDTSNIQFISDPTEEMQMMVVSKTGSFIRYIKNPTEKVKLEAIKNDTISLLWIKDPSELLKIEAIKKWPESINLISNPSLELQKLAIESSNYSIKIISLCYKYNNWENFDEAFEQQILDNLNKIS
jgi:hypothetical protein